MYSNIIQYRQFHLNLFINLNNYIINNNYLIYMNNLSKVEIIKNLKTIDFIFNINCKFYKNVIIKKIS